MVCWLFVVACAVAHKPAYMEIVSGGMEIENKRTTDPLMFSDSLRTPTKVKQRR